jgi:hypothetical protein
MMLAPEAFEADAWIARLYRFTPSILKQHPIGARA